MSLVDLLQTPRRQTSKKSFQPVKIQPIDYDNVDQFFNFNENLKEQHSFQKPSSASQLFGRWSQEQHRKYLSVIRMKLDKKLLQKKLLQEIPSRNDSQIRAHHQKMLKRYKTLENIQKTTVMEIEGIKELIPKADKVIEFLKILTNQEPMKIGEIKVEEMLDKIEVVDERHGWGNSMREIKLDFS